VQEPQAVSGRASAGDDAEGNAGNSKRNSAGNAAPSEQAPASPAAEGDVLVAGVGAVKSSPRKATVAETPQAIPVRPGEAGSGRIEAAAGTESLPAAVRVVLARVAAELEQVKPGRVRELDLKLASSELGPVRVHFELVDENHVRVVIRTSSEQAAQSLRDGLPSLRQMAGDTRIVVDVAQIAVRTAADFGGTNYSNPRFQWQAAVPQSAVMEHRDDTEPAARSLEGPRRRTLVDILA
jgi:flagellar hook-length control protein FliK